MIIKELIKKYSTNKIIINLLKKILKASKTICKMHLNKK